MAGTAPACRPELVAVMSAERSTETLPDGSVKVILKENGIEAACYVSSHHLVDDKWGYLQDAIDRQAMRAFNDHVQELLK